MPDATAPVRDAASLLVVKPGPAGPLILMGRRAAGHRFMPNRLVFPGGAVDGADFSAPVASPLRPAVLARLQRSAQAGLAHALAVAAARELQEEVGLSLGRPPALAALHYLCRAITPAGVPIRFDARFFVVDSACVTGNAAGSAELEEPAWYSIEAALASGLALATKGVLLQFRSWQPGRDDAAAPVPVLRDRTWTEE